MKLRAPVVVMFSGQKVYGLGILMSPTRWGFSRLDTLGVKTLRLGFILLFRVNASFEVSLSYALPSQNLRTGYQGYTGRLKVTSHD